MDIRKAPAHPSPIIKEAVQEYTTEQLHVAIDTLKRVVDVDDGRNAYNIIEHYHNGGVGEVIRYALNIAMEYEFHNATE